MSEIEVSIIVVTLKDRDEIECLNSIDEEVREQVEIIIRDEKGICAARNAGIRAATNDKLIFLDDDAIPHDGYIEHAANRLDEYDVIAGRVVDSGHPWVGKIVSHYDQGDKIKQTTQIVGCNMAFRKEVFEKVGLFDEKIQWGHDEKELALRVLEEYNIVYDPDLAVTHPYSSDLRDYLEKRYRLGLADIYYWKKTGKMIPLKLLATVFSPKTYIDNSLRGTLVKLPTGFSKVLGQLVGYKQLVSENEIFR